MTITIEGDDYDKKKIKNLTLHLDHEYQKSITHL